MSGQRLDASALLRIDYAAERRKLAAATQDAAWRTPAELVRRALRSGAAQVAVEQTRDGVVVRDDGPALAPETLIALATLRDPRAAEESRHAALVRLEPEPGLLAASPRLVHARIGGGNRLLLRGLALDDAAWSALGAALRFGPPGLSLGGRAPAVGFAGALAQGPLEAPLRGGVALTGAEEAEVALVQDGVVVAHVSLPEAPSFSAWVDASGLGIAGANASPAALRAAFEPHAPALVLAAVDLALVAARRPEPPAEAQCQALLGVLLAAAARGLRRGEILRAPLLPALESGRPVRRSLLELGADADAAPGRTLWVLDPEQDPAETLLPDAPVYRLAPTARARIAALLGVRFRPALPKDARGGVIARVRRTLRDLGAAGRRATAWLRHPGASRPLQARELRPQEAALGRALGRGLAFTDAAGPIVRVAGEWRLPRRNPLVAAAADAVAADARFVYPAALALFEGRRELPPGAAEAWGRSG
jgi:hypothetical protein